jgi:hypothetical protein
MGLLDDLLAIKRELARDMPPSIYAVRCHPADARALRRIEPIPNKTWFTPFGGIPLFVDPRVPRGVVRYAASREEWEGWLRDEWRDHLIATLRRRLETLAPHRCAGG